MLSIFVESDFFNCSSSWDAWKPIPLEPVCIYQSGYTYRESLLEMPPPWQLNQSLSSQLILSKPFTANWTIASIGHSSRLCEKVWFVINDSL